MSAAYDELLRVLPSPVVRLHRAVAVAVVGGPAMALALVEELAGELDRHHLWHATRADLLRRLGRGAEARSAYAVALDLAPSIAGSSPAASPLLGEGCRIRRRSYVGGA